MILLRPLSLFFQSLVEIKNALYDRGILKAHPLKVPVISVGNLSVGGTGKTSFVLWLMRSLVEKGRRVGVVSRGYGGSFKGSLSVPVNGDPKVFGDEPCLLAAENKGPVFVGGDRVATGEALLESHQVDFIVADDAFQHRRLFRHMNIVLVDLSEPWSSFRLLPEGRLREGFSSLSRADVVVLTKASLAETQETAQRVRPLIPSDKLCLEMDYSLDFVSDSEGRQVDLNSFSYVLFSGVAKPETVARLMKDRVNIVDQVVYGDHHAYSQSDVNQLLEKSGAYSGSRLLTTAKDAVKLKNYPELKERLHIIRLKFDVKGEVDEFFKILDR